MKLEMEGIGNGNAEPEIPISSDAQSMDVENTGVSLPSEPKETGPEVVALEPVPSGNVSPKTDEHMQSNIGDTDQHVANEIAADRHVTNSPAIKVECEGGIATIKEENVGESAGLKMNVHEPPTEKKAEIQLGDAIPGGTPPKKDGASSEYPVRGEVSTAPIASYTQYDEGDDSGSEEEQVSFMKELENFHKERSLEFKAPKFYGEGLNCLKLWRQVTRLGGYEQVTSCKLWRQVGESFRPPKTCTTVSWTFRGFYEKALLEYEKHKIRTGELLVPVSSLSEPISAENQSGGNQAAGSGRVKRDSAVRAMQGWHSQRLLSNGEVGDPIIKDKSSISLLKRDKHLKNIGVFKRKKTSSHERPSKIAHTEMAKHQTDSMVVDVGPPADWVKINVRRTKDCFEVYALVPGLLREEVHVQSDPAGRLVISGDPEKPDNPWGVTPFKKIVTLPSRIDPHQTSAVVTLHGQLFIRAPYELTEQ